MALVGHGRCATGLKHKVESAALGRWQRGFFFRTEVPLDVLSGKDVGGVHDVLSDLHAPG